MIIVESQTISPEKLEDRRKSVEMLEKRRYSDLAILYFLHFMFEEDVSGRHEGDNFIITLS